MEHQAGIPLLMTPLSGHSVETQGFGAAVRPPVSQWQTTYGLTSLVAERALSREANLEQLAQTQMKWITRVPAPVRDAQAAWAPAEPPAMVALQAGYRAHELTRPTAAWSHAGSSSTPSPARLKRSAPLTSSGASRVTRQSKP